MVRMGREFDVALTVDVEEWFHVCGLSSDPAVLSSDFRVLSNIEKLLAILAHHQARATFFILGSVAQKVPTLVPLIASAGHELASHGFSHKLVTTLVPEEFREELRRTADIVAAQSGRRPVGFRAPQWSLSREKTPWAFDILREEEYIYDSSCNPVRFVGNPAGPRLPFRMELQAGRLWEIPPMVAPSPFGNIPVGGGWGFRFFPRSLITSTICSLNSEGLPAVLFLHPRELDPAGPRIKLPPVRSFAVYGPRIDAAERLESLLKRYRFGTLFQMVQAWESA